MKARAQELSGRKSRLMAGLVFAFLAAAPGAHAGEPIADPLPRKGIVRDAVTKLSLSDVLILPWETWDQNRDQPTFRPLRDVHSDSLGAYVIRLGVEAKVLFWKQGYAFTVSDWPQALSASGQGGCGSELRDVFLEPLRDAEPPNHMLQPPAPRDEQK